MKLRPARLADIDPLLEIENEAFRTDRLTAAKLRHLIEHGNCTLTVAEERKRLAGYSLVLHRRGSRSARVYGLAVAAAFRRRGLGRRLLQDAERAAIRRGARRLSLETDPSNRRAVALYASMGYVLAEHLGRYYEDGSPADRLAKDLEAGANVNSRHAGGASSTSRTRRRS